MNFSIFGDKYMTQEELDALMNSDVEMDNFEDVSDEVVKDVTEDTQNNTEPEVDILPPGYSEETAEKWPAPATDENKVVHQLDDVTKESEEKASEIFDIIEGISSDIMDKEEDVAEIVNTLESNVQLFETLSKKFPDVETFTKQLELNKDAIEKAQSVTEVLQNSGDSIMNIMDIMQYQDIHRQKIERVINVMRALSKYMNSLFDSKVDDESRVSSAQHIAGDAHDDLASTEDIEALLAQFGN